MKNLHKMRDFLHENNTCGHNLLCLVSRGNAIIAEIFRLKEFIPAIYRLEKKIDQQKYGDVLLDFTFFKRMAEFEKKIETSEILQDIDEEIRENHIELITRFYLLFESIYKYTFDLNQFTKDLDDGMYIQQSIETIFVLDEGKQLMCEALYLAGVILLMVDNYIDGTVRERMLVSYFRYSAQRSSSDCYIDDVCYLLSSTGQSTARRLPNYPEDYFKRAAINELYVKLVVGRLRADDVYHQLKVFPMPEQRSTALATQAAMLFVALFFQPSILHSSFAGMREIVDKYFPDNWVISLYMGETVNLAQAWEPFKAAKTALSNSLLSMNVEAVAARSKDQLQKLLPNIDKLNDDKMTEEQLLENCQHVVNLVRETNVTLRWLLLHTAPLPIGAENHKKSRQLREQVLSVTKHVPDVLFNMLLNTAEFELHVRETIRSMLTGKADKWKKEKEACVTNLVELADVFSGDKPLTRLERNDKLQAWFKEIALQIESLDYEQATATGRKIVHLIQALEEVQEFHGMSTHGQALQVLAETRSMLHGLLRSAGLQEDVSIQLQVIGDMSYAWNLIRAYVLQMQAGIKRDTGLVVKLRATFLKMASALEVPLLRINQARSPDLISVSQYYSSELVSLLRRVLHVIPETMFEIMAKIATLQTDVIKDLPTRLDKEEIKEYAQLDHRFQVAKLTNDVSMLTEGMSVLKSTLVGVIRIDPIQLLEDGIRCELVRHVAMALDNGLTFNVKNKVPQRIGVNLSDDWTAPGSSCQESDLEQKLGRLGEVMEGQKRSFEYIQDYIHIYGLKIWQEEITRIIGYYVEQECNSFLRNKISDAQSVYQSKAIPIPTFPPKDTLSVNCIGRLVREILRITDPRNAVRLDSGMTWVDLRDKHEIIGFRFFGKLSKAIGISGLFGVDRLLSFMIVAELQRCVASWQKVAKEPDTQVLMGDIMKLLAASYLIENSNKIYSSLVSKSAKVTQPVLEQLLKVGQMQLLRKHIAYELNSSCQFESPHLAAALDTFNKAVLWDVRKHFREEFRPHPPQDVLYDLSAQLDCVGMSDAASKIYVTASNVRYFPVLTFLVTLTNLGKMAFPDSSGNTPSKRSSDRIDGASLTMGVQTLLRQFHPDVRDQYLTYMGQYVKSRIGDYSRNKSDIADEGAAITVLETLMKYASLPRSHLFSYIPQQVLDLQPTS